MRVAVFGGTGFVGNYIINELLKSDYKVNVLVREGSESKLDNPDKCNIINGDINNLESIDKTLENCETVILFKRKLFSQKRKSLRNILKDYDIKENFNLDLRVENLNLKE